MPSLALVGQEVRAAGNTIFGWVVSDKAALQQPLPMVAASRVKRSLYLLQVSDGQLLAGPLN